MTSAIRRIKNRALNIFWKAAGIPLTNNSLEFESMFHELNMSFYNESNFISSIIEGIRDEEIIYQKGEGPEAVFNSSGNLIPREGMILMLKYFIAKRIELILDGANDPGGKSILDVGATSDLLFRYLNKKGVGLNISQKAVDHMKSSGIEAVLGDAEKLDYPDKSFDYILCFETLEHLENPLRALREFKRVAREKIFITIPAIDTTKICGWEPSERGVHRWHFIELNNTDFEKIAQRVGLKITRNQIIRTSSVPATIKHKLFFSKWHNSPWFKGYRFYELAP
ncbi:MAG: hypothetical protein A2293_15480 [Elusimicrobia bacterium RIFOXYB2_FULL_49_7]|nr:MAG: hypothetical protein A2293_15480 [Elusimicrobia bacterium RIFOXYB2_FULL_49_7]